MSESDQKPDDLYLVDGSGFIFRAYFALPQTLTNPRGEPVGAVLGFCNMLFKLLQDFHAPAVAVIFDAARKNYRNDIYPEYKANREAPPEDLIPQFPYFRKAAEAFGIPALELEGYEADDLIAAYAKQAASQGKRVTIVGSDKDMFQLITDQVSMYDPIKQKRITAVEVMEKFGVPPDKVIEVQSLSGDPVDNIPGVPGIGPKTAAQLINEYGDLETLLVRVGEIKQPKRREALIENAEKARISKRLVKLDDAAPLPVKLEDLRPRGLETPDLIPFLKDMGFKSLLNRIGQGSGEAHVSSSAVLSKSDEGAVNGAAAIADNRYQLITTEEALSVWMEKARQEGRICIDTETTSLTPAKAKLVGVALCVTPGEAAYVPVGHSTGRADLLDEPQEQSVTQLAAKKVMEILKPVLEDPAILKIAHNFKYDWQILARYGVRVSPCDDTMLISYVLDGAAHSHGMDNLSKLYLDHHPIPYEAVAGKGKSQIGFDRVSIELALNYAAEDADITMRLHQLLKPRLAREKMTAVYEMIERPLIPVIAEMELAGIQIDPQHLKSMSADFALKLAALEKDIHALAGTPFNVGSPKQVGDILFGTLGLTGGKKTKTGQYSTDVKVLEQLAAEGHEIVEKILEWRQLSKLKSTYTDALPHEINPETGRIHTSFAIAHTNTGRLSSSDPNLQNIPIRTEEGRKIREAFIAAPGHVLISVDYSQVELRLAAAMAGIKALSKAFEEGGDIHSLTAAQVFDIPPDQVTPEIRRQAKAVNFGIIYGISGYGLAKQLGTTPQEANAFIQKYLSRFPELQTYMEDRKEEARLNGFIKTFYGRKCVISGIKDKNGAVRSFAERQAINAPLQGTAADIMKIAMGRMPRALAEAGLKTRMLLQVHDELVFEAPEDEAQKAAAIIVSVMEGAAILGDMNLPAHLTAEAGTGASWATAH